MNTFFSFYSLHRSKSLFLAVLIALAFILQSSDNKTSSAHAHSVATVMVGSEMAASYKTDRWMSPSIRPGIYATRLAHLWDGTSESELVKMPAPKADRLMLAYAPEMLPQTDAVRALERFGNTVIPQPKPRPAGLASNKKAAAPMELLAGFPKPVAVTLEQPQATQPDIKIASLGPVSLPADDKPGGTITASLNLPYTLQIPSVQTGCFPEKLVDLMQKIEVKYQKKVVVTSGLRDHGRRGSLHLHCAAADIIVPGVPSTELARFAKTLPGIGGVGRYCHPYMIHIDVGRSRDWNFGCAKPAEHDA